MSLKLELENYERTIAEGVAKLERSRMIRDKIKTEYGEGADWFIFLADVSCPETSMTPPNLKSDLNNLLLKFKFRVSYKERLQTWRAAQSTNAES